MVAAVVTAVVSLALALAAARFGWLGPDVGRGSGFCEAPSGGWVVQPANTWSNLGFVAAGLAVAAYAADRVRLGVTMGAHPGLALTYAVVVVLLGPGSMAMHATQTQLGGQLDLLSMFLVSGFALAYAVMRLLRRGPGLFAVLFPVLVLVGMVVLLTGGRVPLVRHSGNAAFAVMILLAVVVEIVLWRRRDPKQDAAFGVASVVVLLVAYTVWQFGRRGHPWCEPESLLQWHGLWHVLCAVAAYLLFRHDVAERAAAR
ncbi:ceramidase domain-containing protein [Oryzobacter telluris]|uniref:ceramidase domain-containing protein n=1 Tax=Oryzobacter telluris TaxID=3149179 RepID=UPI00370D432E